MSRKSIYLILLAIFIFAYTLRVLFLKDLSLTFGYDQARDAIISQQILDGDVKIQGPSASTPSLHHGVFYYYVLAPAYFFGNGNPLITAYWVAFLNALVVFIVFYLTFLLTKKYAPSLLAAFLFAISFEAVQYATWLSNPTIAIWTVPLMYLGLWAWIDSKKGWGPTVAAIGLGLSIQAEIFLLYHAIPLVFWLWVSKKNITRKHLVNFSIFLLLCVLTIIFSEIKFGFKGFEGLRQLAEGSENNLAYAKSLGDYFILYFNQIGRIFAFNSYPGNIGYGGLLVIVLSVVGIIQSNKVVKFLSTWLFSHATVVTVGGTSTPFLMVGIGPAVSILIAYYLHKWWSSKYKFVTAFVLVLLAYGNLTIIFRENPRGSTLFAIQKDMILKNELAAIDYTYQESKGEPFSINSLTSPLWINIVWTYLYKWYGLTKYGYLPTWHGHDQIGQLDSLAKSSSDIQNYFLILEPMGGIPERYLSETIGEEDSYSAVLEEKYLGELRIQKRQKLLTGEQR